MFRENNLLNTLYSKYSKYTKQEKKEEIKYTYIDIDSDLSVFTLEESKHLSKMYISFRTCQFAIETESESIYSWMFNKYNPKKEENELYKKKIYWLDNQLQQNFGVKFTDILPLYYNNYEPKTLDTIIEIYNKKNITDITNITTDKLRKWFIDNLAIIEEYYYSITNIKI